MSTTVNNLPLMQSAQAQKFLTFNSAISYLDALVNPTVFNRTTSAPPVSPTEGDRYIVGPAPTGAWTGQANRIAVRIGTNWVIFTPSEGWNVYDQGANEYVSYNGSAWVTLASLVGSAGSSFADNLFELFDNLDNTKKAVFQLSGFPTATTYTYTLPNSSSTLAILAATQTFTGTTTFSGTFEVSAASASLGTAVVASTANVGSGAITTGLTKTVNLGTGGLSGSTTGINIGSVVAGSLGTLVINSPTVTFSSLVTAIAAAAANLSVLRIGIGGATADATNRLSINTPAVLLNNAGTSIDMTFNKNAAANDASLSFKTGFSTRGIFGLLGDDDLTAKVSPDGTTFYTGLIIKASDGRVEFPEPLVLQSKSAVPAAPAAGKLAIYARSRAGQSYVDVQRPSGRDFPLQPHFGVNRIARWSPSVTATISVDGMPITNVGTVSHPTLASTTLITSMRRWTITSAAVINSVCDQRSAGWVCFRGNAAGRGGWSYTSRLSLTTLQATGMAFFGLYGLLTALSTTLLLNAVVNAIGIGFQRGTHTNWQLVHNDGAGAPTLTDLGANFPVNNTDVLTLFTNAAPNGSDIGVRVVNETTGSVYEGTITTEMPAATQFLSPRNYMNNEATAAAVAFDCSGVYIETDF